MKKIKNVADLRLRKSELQMKQQHLEKDIREKWSTLRKQVLRQGTPYQEEKNGNGKIEHVLEAYWRWQGKQ